MRVEFAWTASLLLCSSVNLFTPAKWVLSYSPMAVLLKQPHYCVSRRTLLSSPLFTLISIFTSDKRLFPNSPHVLACFQEWMRLDLCLCRRGELKALINVYSLQKYSALCWSESWWSLTKAAWAPNHRVRFLEPCVGWEGLELAPLLRVAQEEELGVQRSGIQKLHPWDLIAGSGWHQAGTSRVLSEVSAKQTALQ